MKHTPTPYKQLGHRATGIGSACGKIIGFVSSNNPEDLANLSFIVQACNSHDDLVAALQRLMRAFEADYEQMPDIDIRTSWQTNSQAIEQARAALKRAKGETND